MTEDLAERLRELSPQQRRTILERMRARETRPAAGSADSAEAPLSAAQERLYFLDQLDPGNPAYNVPVALRIRGPLESTALDDAVTALTVRHAALRCVFSQGPDGPRQRVGDPVPIAARRIDLRDAPATLGRKIAEHAQTRLDLAAGPLLDAVLFTLGDEEHLLHVIVHHIAFDGWSAGIAVGDLSELYRARVEGRAPTLAPLSVQYPDFAVWERAERNAERFADQLASSCQRLTGAPPVLDLPTDLPRPAVRGNRGGHVPFTIGPEVTERLAGLAREEGTTLYATMLSAFVLLLARAAGGDEEIVVGTPVAGRLRASFEPLIGCFANTLVLRTAPGRAGTFRELLRGVHAEVRRAFAAQEVPYARLVEELAPVRDPARNPLFQVMFGYADLPVGGTAAQDGEPQFAMEFHDTGLTDFEIFLSITRRGQVLDAMLGYSADLFLTETMRDLIAGYESLLGSLSADPDRSLDDFPALRRTTVAVAATFTADPVVQPLRGWLRQLGLGADVELVPYGQVYQQLLAADSVLARDPSGTSVVLMRWEDWLRNQDRGTPDAPAAVVAMLDRCVSDLVEAIKAFRSHAPTALWIVVCPPSASWSTASWPGIFAGLQDRLAQACAQLPDVRLMIAAADGGRYPVAQVHDAAADQLASIPYTTTFFTALATTLVRQLYPLPAVSATTIAFDPGRLLGTWPRRAVDRFKRLLERQARYGRKVLAVGDGRAGADLLGDLGTAGISVATGAGQPAENLAAAIAEEMARASETGGSFIVLDPDPAVCSAVRERCPAALAVPMPSAATAHRTLEHLWVLDAPQRGRLGVTPLFPARIAQVARELYEVGAIAERLTRRAPAGVSVLQDQPHAEPGTPTELRVARLWAELLDTARVSVTANFFALGGHSFLAVDLLSRLRADFGRDITFYEFLVAPTVRRLAGLIDSGPAAGENDGPVPVPRERPLPLSPTQQRMWALAQTQGTGPRHNIAFAAQLTGALDEVALRVAVADLLARHEVLRTTFVARDGLPELSICTPDARWAALAFPATELVDAGPDGSARIARLLADRAAEPFDLERGPLIRIRLLASGEQRHHLLIVMHHAVSDDWSWRVFLAELAECYAARLHGTDIHLPALELQFADYADWQNRQAAEPAWQAQLEQWKALFSGVPPMLAMPTDSPRPEIREGSSGRAEWRIDRTLTSRLRAISRVQEVPLFSLLLTGFAVLLSRCAEQETFAVGVPVANREREGMRSVLGYFADLLPIRLDVDLDAPLRELVRGIHRSVTASRALQDIPLSGIVDAVRPLRVPGHNPLFQVVFNFLEGDEDQLELTGISLTPVELPPVGTDFDLFLNVGTAAGELLVSLDYSTELYAPASADRLVAAFACLLEGLADEEQETARQIEWPDNWISPALRTELAAEQETGSAGNLLAVAAGFTAEPIAAAVRLWGGMFGREENVAFAPYAQVFHQLLDPDGVFSAAAADLNAVLLRWEDWVRHVHLEPADATAANANRLVSVLERNLADLCDALSAYRAWSGTPLLIAVCPPSPRWATPLWSGVYAGLFDRLSRYCAGLGEVRVIAAEHAARAYLEDEAEIHDAQGDELGHLPYTPEFFSVLGTVLAREAIAAGAGRDMILFDPTRVFSLLGPDQDGPVSAAEWAHDDAVAAMVRNRAIAAGRTVTLTSAQDSARTLLAARSDLLPSGARIRWEPAARPSGLDEADPAARYAAVIGASTAAPDRWVVLDPDPEVCAKTSMALPRAAAVLVPAGAAGVRRALEHAWLLDGDPAAGPWPGTSNATDVQVRILDEGLCDAAAVHAAAIRGRRAAAGQPYAPPRNERETILADVWADLLGHERVGIHDDFFALGGDSMTAIQVVSQAARQGIAVSPRQVLEAKTVAELAAAQAPVVVAAEQGQITGPVPLSAAQRWFFDQPAARMEYPTLFNHPYYLTVATGIDAGTLSAALRFLVDHHDGLRARFTRTAAGQWTQQTEPCGVPVPFESVDLSGLEPADREARAVEAAAAAQAGLDLSAGPLVRALHMSFGGAERDRLLIVNHHLVVDAVSRGVILEDLATVSAQLTAGEQPRLPAKTTSYRAWSGGLASYADSAELRAELPFWLSQVAAAGDAGIPIDYPDGVASFDAARTASVDLGEDLTAALHRFAGRELHSGLSDLIVGVTALELAEWTGRRDCRLALAGHGREDVVPGISLSRTVGWFQIYYPLLLTVPEAADLGVLRSVRSQLSAVPRNGIGHSVLRYLCTDEAVRADLAAGHQPQVSFNYMGDFGFEDTSRHTDLFGACTRPYGPTEDGQGVWPYLMDIVPGMVGRSLRIDVNYSENVHRRATAEGLAKRITDRLTRLVR